MSTRITNSMITRSLLADLNDVADRLARTQRKLSSGKELTRPSDDPFAVSRAMTLRSALEGTRQYQRNVGEATAWQNVTETALSRITDTVQRARELLVQGASDSAGQVAREAIAAEIDSLTDTIKQEANATYGGRYVFSGTATDTPPYAVGGADAYAGNGASVAREIGPGVSVSVNVVGSTLLGNGQAAADNKLLHVLRDIADHLRGGTAADANALRTTDLARLDQNLDEITRVRAVVGSTTKRLETANSRLAEIEEANVKLLSDTEDADMARTLVDFSTQQAVYQSALRSGANIVQASLLDFLR
jgi:flagellar hook-associated protein 3 FlgL